CVLTSPSCSVYAGIEGEPINLGKNLRFFGDGYQISKVIGGIRYWRVPVMDGEFLCQETTGMVRAVGGGNFLVLAKAQSEALAACEASIDAMSRVLGVIMPFPGGVVRSGSKVGSKYKSLTASTNDAFCPTLRGATHSALGPEVGAVLEIVIDGLTETAVRESMRAGIAAVCDLGAARGVLRISAGNYGGKLGKFHFRLREIMA
ncbi:MAG: formylmethanofuran--tetrahydromethanopterin N-formyltransferase, partial [Burkholderiales bacterium]